MSASPDQSQFSTPPGCSSDSPVFVPTDGHSPLPTEAAQKAERDEPDSSTRSDQPAEQTQPTECTRAQRTEVFGIPFDRVTLAEAVAQIGRLIRRSGPSYVITANLNYVMLHHHQPTLRPVTRDADLILADGQPIVWRSKWSSSPLPERVAGSELIYHLAEQASQNDWGVYFLGGKPGVAATCAERLATLYPGLKVAGVESPPFRPLSDDEQAEQAARIRHSGAHLLLVAFGQPKGEQWIHDHYQRLGVPVSIQLGASFDFIAGTASRAPVLWQRLGLEWAHRMLSDPKRLVPRYASNARFLLGSLLGWRKP